MEIPRHWRLKAQRYRLEGSLCPVCGQPIFPPRPLCPSCAVQQTRIAGSQTQSGVAPRTLPVGWMLAAERLRAGE